MFALLLTWTILATTAPPANEATTAEHSASFAARDWTDASGTKRVRAALLRVEGEKLWLRRSDGKLTTTAVSQLSLADRQYVATRPTDAASKWETKSISNSLTTQIVKKIGDGAQSIAKLPGWTQPSQSEGQGRLVPAAIVYVRVSRDFLEDYVERQVNRTKPVHDYILGTRIVGESDTSGKTRLELLPSSGRLSGKISFEGTVHARTQGYNGPVVLHQISDSTFRATKTIALDGSGLKVAPTVTRAPTHLTTTSIGSSLPRLRGRIATRIAWRRVGSSQGEAESITGQHTAAIISNDFDERTNASLAKLQEVFRSKIPELNSDDGPKTAEVRFRTNKDSVEMAMVRVDAVDAERKLRPPVVEGNPDVAVRVHRVMLTQAITDPQVRDDLAPLFAKLLKGRFDHKELVATGNEVGRAAESTKWSINLDWLAFDFTDPTH
jgi:hypothetical protein